jgi:glycosyltransferase involved in cell wall biosynthesis
MGVRVPAVPFTVFTPTFNRRHSLPRAYASLCAQTFLDFEWLVVDDGSTDDTASLVAGWQSAAPFPIRYVYEENRGKHAAYNRAIELAQGELFTILDSDDALVPRALERLSFHWRSIPEPLRERYSGVTCLAMDERSRIVGRPFPADVVDCRHYEIESRLGAVGEKWGCHRTEVLRRYPFPEVPGERYCADALVWNRIARRYLVRNVNEPLRVYFRHAGGIMGSCRALQIQSPQLSRLYFREYLELDVPLLWAARRAVGYVRFSLHAGVRWGRILLDSPARAVTAAAALPATLLYGADLLRQASRSPS